MIIGGPTASGKTALSVRVAQHYNCPILSADSRQVYREMSIGTARPSQEELSMAPHYFIGNRSVAEPFSAGQFEREALALLKDLFKNNHVVVVAGGTGLYIKALIEGLDTFPKIDQSIRDEINQLFEESGIQSLQSALNQLDPEYYKEVDVNNPQRLIRALTVIKSSGRKFSEFRTQSKIDRPFKCIPIYLDLPREVLYLRINSRVDKMMVDGLLDEVKSLKPYQHLSSLNTVGYKELFAYLNNDWNLEMAVDKIKQHTRNYAKRQVTWFKNQTNFQPMRPDNYSEIIDFIDYHLEK